MNHIVLDLEMCKVTKGNRRNYHRAQETIQIGAVLLNDKYEVVDSFNEYVKPEYGTLTKEIVKLTGITEKDLVNAKVMKEVMEEFLTWIPEGEIEMVSWSDTDYYQIKRECEEKKLLDERVERILSNWNDCQKTFGEKLEKNRAVSLEEALIATGIYQEKAHDGYDDAYNTALLFKKMETEQELILNPLYESARKEEVEHLTSSIGDLLGFDFSLCYAV